MSELARKVGIVAGVFTGTVHLCLQALETFSRMDTARIKYPMTWQAHVLDEPSVIVPFRSDDAYWLVIHINAVISGVAVGMLVAFIVRRIRRADGSGEPE